MALAPIAAMHWYEASDEALVYLIGQTVNGSPERRLAARFVLDCLRAGHTRGELEECIEGLEAVAILDVATDARDLAASLGLR